VGCAESTLGSAPGWYVLGILSLLMGFGSISTDLYLPAMPAMGRALGAEAGLIELTISGYLIGFSLGQLLWGPISDCYGRRSSVSAGLIFFVIGSAGCAFAGTAQALIGWRIVQAIGACACVALSRAMVRDLYAGDRAAQMLSMLMTIMTIAPILGPLLGGQVVALAGWRAVFCLLVIIGGLTLALLWTIPETLPSRRRKSESLGVALRHYRELLTHRHILGYALTGGFLYAGMFAYVAGTPSIYINYYQVTEQSYGFFWGIVIAGAAGANLINARLVVRHGHDRILILGAVLMALAAFTTAWAAGTDWGGLWGLVLSLFVFISSVGFIVANAVAGAMTRFPERAGAVSALVGAVHYGSGIIGSSLVGFFADGTPWPMGVIIGLTGVGCLLSTLLLLQAPEK